MNVSWTGERFFLKINEKRWIRREPTWRDVNTGFTENRVQKRYPFISNGFSHKLPIIDTNTSTRVEQEFKVQIWRRASTLVYITVNYSVTLKPRWELTPTLSELDIVYAVGMAAVRPL